MQGRQAIRTGRTAASLCAVLLALLCVPAAAFASPGITLSPFNGLTVEAEEAGPAPDDSYTVVLNEAPSDNVTIDITGDAEAAPSAPQLVFTPGDWNVAQVVTAVAVDDAVGEGPHGSTFTHDISSLDLGYDGLGLAYQAINITDNDPRGVIIVESGGGTYVTEGQVNGDQYQVYLDTIPTDDVTVNIVGDGQATSVQASLTFTPLNYAFPQTVQVGAADDILVEGGHTGALSHNVTSNDPFYNGRPTPSLVAQITDNDAPAVSIQETGGATFAVEGGSSDSYSLVLLSPPLDDVTVTVTPDAQSVVGPASVTFTPANWNTPRFVTVTPIDDFWAEGSHTSLVTHSATSLDPDYDNLGIASVTLNITDNDVPGVVITESGISTDVAEGGINDSYDIRLTTQPAGNVQVTVSGGTELVPVPSPLVLTFTSGNWNQDQTVDVAAIDDVEAEPALHAGTITHTLSSTDLDYDGMAVTPILATITENDTAGITLAGTPLSVDEAGGTDTYTVVLDTQPTADVTIAFTSPSETDVTPPTLTFTAADWNTPQTVTVTSIDDTLPEGNEVKQIVHDVSSTDPVYDPLTIPDQAVTVVDDDVPTVMVVPTGGSTALSEGSTTDTYTVRLSSQPANDVSVAVDPGLEATSDVSSLTFTSTDWGVAQTVTLTAVDDETAEGPHTSAVSHSVTTTDPAYNGLTVAPFSFSVTDNDTPVINVGQVTGPLPTTEGGAGATYTLVLGKRPLADVVITLAGGEQLTTQPAAVTFTPTDWNQPRTVTVKAIDDDVDESDNHPGVVTQTVTSTQALYNGLTMLNIDSHIKDNDTRGVVVIQADGNTAVSESGGADSVELKLLTKPAADVTVELEPDKQIELSKRSLAFTPANWATAQKVEVSAVDDKEEEGAHASVITFKVGSNDTLYKGLAIPQLDVAITDNDVTAGNVILGDEGDDVEAGKGKKKKKPKKAKVESPSSAAGRAQARIDERSGDTPPPAAAAPAPEAKPKPKPKAVTPPPPAPAEEEPAEDAKPKSKPKPFLARLTGWAKNNQGNLGGLGIGLSLATVLALMLRGGGAGAAAAAQAGVDRAAQAKGRRADPKGRPDQKARQQEAKDRRKKAQADAKQKRADRKSNASNRRSDSDPGAEPFDEGPGES